MEGIFERFNKAGPLSFDPHGFHEDYDNLMKPYDPVRYLDKEALVKRFNETLKNLDPALQELKNVGTPKTIEDAIKDGSEGVKDFIRNKACIFTVRGDAENALIMEFLKAMGVESLKK